MVMTEIIKNGQESDPESKSELTQEQASMQEPQAKKQNKENPLLNLGFNIVIPMTILMKFSGDQHLGQVYGLILALFFPIAYGVYDLIKSGKVNIFSLLGLVSVLMTGVIGLLELNRNWMIVKETAFPLVMGLFVFASEFSGKPLVTKILDQMIDIDAIKKVYDDLNMRPVIEKRLKTSSYLFGSTFFISAILNFLLAYYVLEGEPGTEEFVNSLGKMTGLSFPVIALPMMIMVGYILFHLFSGIKKETNAEIEQFFRA